MSCRLPQGIKAGGKNESTQGDKMMRCSLTDKSVALLLLLLVACSAPSPIKPVNATADGIAIKGYDPVAYFLEHRPMVGSRDVEYAWQGVTWRFVSAEHRRLFQEAPGRYAPQFGGYCAYAISQGTSADIDPGSWTIVDDRLYLNLNPDVQRLWQQNQAVYIEKARANWPGLIGNPAPGK